FAVIICEQEQPSHVFRIFRQQTVRNFQHLRRVLSLLLATRGYSQRLSRNGRRSKQFRELRKLRRLCRWILCFIKARIDGLIHVANVVRIRLQYVLFFLFPLVFRRSRRCSRSIESQQNSRSFFAVAEQFVCTSRFGGRANHAHRVQKIVRIEREEFLSVLIRFRIVFL